MELSGVADCFALAAPNPITGQTVLLQVVADAGEISAELKSAIRHHCRQRLDRYKCPTRINFVEKTTIGDRLKRNRRLV